MDKFNKWLVASFSLGIIGFFLLFIVEDFARITGEINRNRLLTITLTIFIMSLTSLFCIFIANTKRIISEIIISILISIFPLITLVGNGLIFTVYFIGK